MSEQGTARRRAGVPEATVARLAVYLRALHALAEEGHTTVSSETLARLVGGGSWRRARTRTWSPPRSPARWRPSPGRSRAKSSPRGLLPEPIIQRA